MPAELKIAEGDFLVWFTLIDTDRLLGQAFGIRHQGLSVNLTIKEQIKSHPILH